MPADCLALLAVSSQYIEYNSPKLLHRETLVKGSDGAGSELEFGSQAYGDTGSVNTAQAGLPQSYHPRHLIVSS